jgi:ATP synthase protein I
MAGTRDDDHGKKESGTSSPPDEAALSARLSGLGDRLSTLEKTRQTAKGQTGTEEQNARSRNSMMAVGLRLSSELIAGVLVGALIGWGIDYFLSTSPLGMIVFLLLGFAAGVINVMRSAGVMAKQHDRLN